MHNGSIKPGAPHSHALRARFRGQMTLVRSSSTPHLPWCACYTPGAKPYAPNLILGPEATAVGHQPRTVRHLPLLLCSPLGGRRIDPGGRASAAFPAANTPGTEPYAPNQMTLVRSSSTDAPLALARLLPTPASADSVDSLVGALRALRTPRGPSPPPAPERAALGSARRRALLSNCLAVARPRRGRARALERAGGWCG